MKEKLTPAESEAVNRISSLVIINAMIFQEILAKHDEYQISSLETLKDEENVLSAFTFQWKQILEINYYPIFHLARELLKTLTADADIFAHLRSLADAAQRIVSLRAALRHDLMGRVYHKLLADKKYLATYYTRVPSAILLLKLALGNDTFPLRWHDFNELMNFRIADLACGTGTLLMAAADTLTDNYVGAAVRAGQSPNFIDIHKVLAEKIIYGYDVLPSAAHLTASTLALRAPEISFEGMNLWSLMMGGALNSLGSIDFLWEKRVPVMRDMFGAMRKAKQVTGKGEQKFPHAQLPELDLCTMNPPFTRSVGGNLLFGSLPDSERSKAQTKLKKMVRRYDLPANITAGLGSVFVAIADRYLKRGGRLALVLPKALVSGVAWRPTRELLAKNYQVEFLVASHDPERWNFSESTSLSEVMLVARKLEKEEDDSGKSTIVLNLWRNPDTAFEALAIYHTLKNKPAPPGPMGQGSLEFSLDKIKENIKLGEALAFPWAEVKSWPAWILPCAFAQADLIRAAYNLARGKLWLPGIKGFAEVPLKPLGDFATLGPDRRDIHDGFNVSQHPTSFPAFWGHDAQAITTIAQEPNAFLSPLAQGKEGRPLRLAEQLWPVAGRILLAERIRLNTQRLVCLKVSQIVLANMWWPLSFKDRIQNDDIEKALAVWLNSTLGLLLLLSNRLETEGAWIDFKKPVLLEMPMLDLVSLTGEQLTLLAATYDEVCHDGLRPFPEMATDPVRAKIDAAVSKALGLPDFSILRRLLSQEPVVYLKRL
jgi:tRNA1(Val) A37 N6-methylase TrmN6